MSPRRGVRPTLVIALLTLVPLGCEPPEEETPPSVPPESEQEEAAAPAESMPHTVTELAEVQGSGVTGEAMTMYSDETVVVALELDGLPAEQEYAAHIHQGTCAEGGPVALPLEPVMGLADGSGSSTTMFDPEEMPEEGSFFFQVHGEGGAPIACGNMEEGTG